MQIFQRNIDQITHVEVQLQFLKEEYARKRIHNGCLVRITNSVSQDNCSASLGKPLMPNNYPRDGPQPLKILIALPRRSVLMHVNLEELYFTVEAGRR